MSLDAFVSGYLFSEKLLTLYALNSRSSNHSMRKTKKKSDFLLIISANSTLYIFFKTPVRLHITDTRLFGKVSKTFRSTYNRKYDFSFHKRLFNKNKLRKRQMLH